TSLAGFPDSLLRGHSASIAISYRLNQIQYYRYQPKGKMHPKDEKSVAMERLGILQQVICNTLSLSVDEVAAASFLQLGGDSLTAIEVSARCYSSGLTVSVIDIMRCSTLEEVASLASVNDEGLGDGSSSPWSLVAEEELPSIMSQVQEQCHLGPEEEIQDVYPTTALQEGLMMLAVKQPGSYLTTSTIKLAAGVDVGRFQAAWEQTLDVCELLRTRIVHCGSQTLQAVIRTKAKWQYATTLATYAQQVRDLRMTYGSPLCQYWLLDQGTQKVFGIAIHHAIYDAWSLRLILQTVAKLYNGQEVLPMQLVPYTGLIQYITRLDRAKSGEYWRKQLNGASPSSIAFMEGTPSPADGAGSESLMHKIGFQIDSTVPVTITGASVLRAAWAIVVSQYSSSEEAVFGATVTGRQAPIVGVERMAGPAICTVPVRIRVSGKHYPAPCLQQINNYTCAGSSHGQRV
ncbi:condensation-domain-containing protein, partial [Periconia macrospinosa]